MGLNLKTEKDDHPTAPQFKHMIQFELHLETDCRVKSQIPRKDNLTGPVWIRHLG